MSGSALSPQSEFSTCVHVVALKSCFGRCVALNDAGMTSSAQSDSLYSLQRVWSEACICTWQPQFGFCVCCVCVCIRVCVFSSVHDFCVFGARVSPLDFHRALAVSNSSTAQCLHGRDALDDSGQRIGSFSCGKSFPTSLSSVASVARTFSIVCARRRVTALFFPALIRGSVPLHLVV